MAIALSTAGIKVYYGVETTAGTRPATMSAYTEISGIKSISDLNPEPSQLDCTPLSESNYKQYIPGLKDVGGVVTLTANNTDAFQTAWSNLCTAHATGQSATGGPLATWFAIVIPGMTKSFYFTGDPADLGLSAIEVDSVMEINAYVTPNQVAGWAAKPTA